MKKSNELIGLKTVDGEHFEVPEDGSLGLLALGYIGLILWREKRKETQAEKLKNRNPES